MKKLLLLLSLFLGAITPVWAETITLDLTTQEEYEKWTSFNPGDDATSWAYDSSERAAKFNRPSGAPVGNDWLISPGVELQGGVSYRISTWVKQYYSGDKQSYNITVGRAATIDAQTKTLLEVKDYLISKDAYKSNDAVFTPEETGTYYFGIYVYTTTITTYFWCNKMEFTEIVPHPGAVTDVAAKAADLGEMSVELSWKWPVKSDADGPISSITGAKIYRSNYQSFTTSSTYFIAEVEGGEPGAEAHYTDSDISSAGTYYYRVVPFNEAGDSETTSLIFATDKWVGKDRGVKPVSNLEAEIVNENTVRINFSPATEGKNGGYVDPADVTYRILRQAGTSAAQVLEESYSGSIPYVDATVFGLNSYVYTVIPVYNGSFTSTDGVRTQALVLGGAMALPYEELFSSSTSLDFFTIFHGEEGLVDWTYYNAAMRYTGSRDETKADAWAITPAFDFVEGQVYELSFLTSVSNVYEENQKELFITLGKAATAEAQSELLFNEVISSVSVNKSITFIAPETARYYIGFHCYGKTSTGYIYIDNLRLKETSLTPLAVTGLTATPAENGAQKALLSWTNPSKTNADTDIETLSKVEIYRTAGINVTLGNAELVQTFTAPDEKTEAGAKIECEDEVPAAGRYVYHVLTYLGENVSPDAYVTAAWIGKDSGIKAASNVVASVIDENTASIEFTPATGTNGGYIDPADVSYKISREPLGGDAVVIENEYKGSSPYTDSNVEGFNSYTYSVQTYYNGTSAGAAVKSNPVVLGGSAPIPYEEHFDTKDALNMYTMFYGSGGSGNWAYYTSSKCAYFGTGSSADAWLVMPVFKLEAGKAYEMTFLTWLENQTASHHKDLYVKIGKAPTAESLTKELFFETIATTEKVTKTISITVDETDLYYIAFHCYGKSDYYYVFVDDITLNLNETAPAAVSDLAAAAPDGEYTVHVNWTNPTTTNGGAELESISKVELFRDGSLIHTVYDTKPGDAIEYNDELSESEAGSHTYTVVSYLGDVASEESEAAIVWVGPDVPKAVEGLNAVLSEDGKQVEITFEALDANTGGVNGGYVGSISYRVVRMPDEYVVTDYTEDTKVIDDGVDELSLGKYYYEVTASNAAFEGETVQSNTLVLGAAIIVNQDNPYKADFSQEETFDLWTFVPEEETANPYKWTYNQSQGTITAPYRNGYAYMPNFELLYGRYKLVSMASTYSPLYPTELDIVLTKAPEAISSSDEIAAASINDDVIIIHTQTIDTRMGSDIEVEFKAPAPGKFYIGFHDKSAEGVTLYKAELSLLETLTGVEDVALDNLAAVYDRAADVLRSNAGVTVEVIRLDGVVALAAETDGNLSLASLPRGAYVARISNGAEVATVKFVK